MNEDRTRTEVEDLRQRIRELEAELETTRAEELQLRARLSRSESELQQSNALIDAAPLPVVLLDRDGRITDANEAAERLVGQTEESLLGVRVEDLVPERSRARWRDLLRQVSEGQVVRGLQRALSSEQNSAKVILYPHRDADGSIIGVVMTEDVEELKDARSALEMINTELQELAKRDPLTQLSNRRAYENALRREFSRAARSSSPMALLMIDVDYFKEFNDRFGHQVGDECLRQVAQTLRNCLRRPADLLARYGGEEFVVLMPDTDLEGARFVARRMRQAVEDLRIEHPTRPEGVRISLGVAVMVPKRGSNGEVLVKRADRALYHAKRSGRDRIAIAVERSAGGGPRSIPDGSAEPVLEVEPGQDDDSSDTRSEIDVAPESPEAPESREG